MEWLASIKFGVLEVELDVIELLDSKLEIFLGQRLNKLF